MISMNFLMDIAYCNRSLKTFHTLIIRLFSGAQWFSVVSHSHVTTSTRSCLQALSLITRAWNVEGRVKHSFLLTWSFFKTGSCIYICASLLYWLMQVCCNIVFLSVFGIVLCDVLVSVSGKDMRNRCVSWTFSCVLLPDEVTVSMQWLWLSEWIPA